MNLPLEYFSLHLPLGLGMIFLDKLIKLIDFILYL